MLDTHDLPALSKFSLNVEKSKNILQVIKSDNNDKHVSHHFQQHPESIFQLNFYFFLICSKAIKNI